MLCTHSNKSAKIVWEKEKMMVMMMMMMMMMFLHTIYLDMRI